MDFRSVQRALVGSGCNNRYGFRYSGIFLLTTRHRTMRKNRNPANKNRKVVVIAGYIFRLYSSKTPGKRIFMKVLHATASTASRVVCYATSLCERGESVGRGQGRTDWPETSSSRNFAHGASFRSRCCDRALLQCVLAVYCCHGGCSLTSRYFQF